MSALANMASYLSRSRKHCPGGCIGHFEFKHGVVLCCRFETNCTSSSSTFFFLMLPLLCYVDATRTSIDIVVTSELVEFGANNSFNTFMFFLGTSSSATASGIPTRSDITSSAQNRGNDRGVLPHRAAPWKRMAATASNTPAALSSPVTNMFVLYTIIPL